MVDYKKTQLLQNKTIFLRLTSLFNSVLHRADHKILFYANRLCIVQGSVLLNSWFCYTHISILGPPFSIAHLTVACFAHYFPALIYGTTHNYILSFCITSYKTLSKEKIIFA